MTSASRTSRRGRALHAARGLVTALVAVAALHSVGEPASRPKPPPPRYTFAGIPWLVPGDTALARLAARGYRPVPEARDRGRIVCRGRLFEHDAIVTGHLDEAGRLVRWVTLVASRGDDYRWPDMRGVFEEVVSEAEARYGAPRTVTERFRFPYEKGDGREDKALRDEQATIRRAWASTSGDRLTIEMAADVSVVLTYECAEWDSVETRRKARRASDL